MSVKILSEALPELAPIHLLHLSDGWTRQHLAAQLQSLLPVAVGQWPIVAMLQRTWGLLGPETR
jgi:hypothetical protein